MIRITARGRQKANKKNMGFYLLYSTYSNQQLLNIIMNANDYQEEAVIAARYILSTRTITKAEFQAASEESQKGRIEQDKKKKRDRLLVLKINFYISYILSLIFPSKKVLQFVDRLIQLLTVVFCIIWIIALYDSINLFLDLNVGRPSVIDTFKKIEILTVLYLPVAIYLFYRRKTLGWILLIIYQIYSLSISIGLAINAVSGYIESNGTVHSEHSQFYHLTIIYFWIFIIIATFNIHLKRVFIGQK